MTILPETSTPETAQKFPLVPIHQENGELWVDARTLHAALQVGRDFSNWIKTRLDEVGAVEGEEFIVLLSGVTAPQARRVAERIALNLAQDPLVARYGRPLTISGGVAFVTGPGPLDTLVAEADARLYEAKHQGRNRFIWPPEAEQSQEAPAPPSAPTAP